jgi:16S rRNA (adenine1518-N6/adenine1519-N6)-dimethyltransferase
MVVNEALAAFRRKGLRPKKSFGQNFLADARIAQSMAALATEPPGGTVVEIGAGLGALTAPLLARARSVIAIERDRDLCPLLVEAFAPAIDEGRLTIVEDDAKQVDLASLLASGPRPHVLAGNLPYQITGPLLERATALSPRLDRAVFMVQREVADRLIAPPGGDAYGALTVFVSAAFRVERALRVSRGAFRPVPNVDSAVVTLTPLSPPRAAESEAFRAAVHAAFQKRRKMLRNAWASLGTPDAVLRKANAAGIDLDRRGETLSVEEFAGFAEA